MSDGKLSTSALAKQLEVPVQQLFSTLLQHDWIRKVEEGWALTAKGEFEGGSYHHSRRYGRYIAWPPGLLEHPLLKNLEDNRLLSAAALGKSHHLSARQVNRLLVQLHWLLPSHRGWQLSRTGKQLGGQSFDNQQLGLEYVLWPEEIAEHPAFVRLLGQCRLDGGRVEKGRSDQPEALVLQENDLFGSALLPPLIDGRELPDAARWQIGQWLCLAGIRFFWGQYLPVEESLRGDFYLPEKGVFLEFWDIDDSAEKLSQRMRRTEILQLLNCPVVDIRSEDLPHLDEYLSRRLQEMGVDFY